MFQNITWSLLKLFETGLMIGSKESSIKIVKLLLEQKGIDINAKSVL